MRVSERASESQEELEASGRVGINKDSWLESAGGRPRRGELVGVQVQIWAQVHSSVLSGLI